MARTGNGKGNIFVASPSGFAPAFGREVSAARVVFSQG
jgi:hypothetical protein